MKRPAAKTAPICKRVLFDMEFPLRLSPKLKPKSWSFWSSNPWSTTKSAPPRVSLRQEYRQRRLCHDGAGSAAQDEFAQPRMPEGAHDKQVGLVPGNIFANGVADGAPVDYRVFHLGPHAVRLKMPVDLLQRKMIWDVLLASERQDRDLLCLLKQCHGVGQGARRGPAEVPGHRNPV